MADTCITCDVAIVGSGFAGSLIANELSKKGIKVAILEAGPGVQPNINDFMTSFYKANAKVPESPYPPAVSDTGHQLMIRRRSPSAGRPRSRCPNPTGRTRHQAYLDQNT